MRGTSRAGMPQSSVAGQLAGHDVFALSPRESAGPGKLAAREGGAAHNVDGSGVVLALVALVLADVSVAAG
jgi:hypothetical protein